MPKQLWQVKINNTIFTNTVINNVTTVVRSQNNNLDWLGRYWTWHQATIFLLSIAKLTIKLYIILSPRLRMFNILGTDIPAN